MVGLVIRVGDAIDALWRGVGLDLDGYAAREPVRARRLGVWLLAAGQTIGYASLYYVFAALLLTWDTSLDWGKERLTLAFMVAILTGAAVSPFAGRLIDRGRGRWLLGGGAALGALALATLGTVESYAAFLMVWVVIGVAQGTSLYEPCFAFVTRTTATEAARNITRITLVAGFASTLAYPTGAFLGELLGWRGATWTFAAALGLVGAPLLFAGATLIECCPHASRTAEAVAQDRAAFRTARRRPEFWLLFAAFPLIGLTEGLVLTHIIPILVDAGLSLSDAVFAAALFGPMQVVGRLAMMRLAGRVSELAMTALSFTGIVVAVLLLMQVEDVPAAAYAFAVLFGASYGLVSILKPVVAASVLGRSAFGAIAGVLAVPFLVSLAVAPQVGSSLWRLGGYDLALQGGVLTACLALTALAALAIIVRGRRTP
ncbi:MAG: MFS transporter [Pseudomonadota bacterium]